MTEQTIKQTMLYYNMTREEAINKLNKTRKNVERMTNNIKNSRVFKNIEIVTLRA